MESELEKLRKERIELEKKAEEKSEIEIEKKKIAELRKEENTPKFFRKLKHLSADIEMGMHPERFNKDGSRKKGKAGMKEWQK
jgi:hypothetical protein